ncbi:MAG: sigma-54-dependent Fis family transcriptional regulator [Comamonadaceae bacterium]|nr:MAG: sigma-54-dependent Fis family transcriptional regulator [Comamonadaceae bacterium]
MSSPSIPQRGLWLDPFRALGTAEQAQLAVAGLQARVVTTLDELQELLSDADCLVIRLAGSVDLLREVQALMKSVACQCPVICRVERKSLEIAVAAMHEGACHVLDLDDWSAAQWQIALARPQAKSLKPVQAAPARPAASRSVVYVDPASRNLLALAQRVAQANVTVLLEGPTGSGKEVLARVLHESSPAASGPFIGLNCAAIPELMIEDMLFGHEKGAFTGALKEHKGLFEQAQGGTLFLDEITEMPIHLQAKLLRVLQERTLVRLGGDRLVSLDVRVIAATNKNLAEAILQREFREDLYFRLSTFKLRVPALQQRPGDILPLVARLLARHAADGQPYRVNAEAQAQLLAYAWPGNVRELENVVLRAIVICSDHLITHEHLMFDDNAALPVLAAAAPVEADLSSLLPQQPIDALAPIGAGLQANVKCSEQRLIQAALETTQSRDAAAKKLGISPRTLRYKMAKFRSYSQGLALTS